MYFVCSQDGLLNAALDAAADLSLEPALRTAIPEPWDIARHFTLTTSGDCEPFRPTGEDAWMPLFEITFVFVPRRAETC